MTDSAAIPMAYVRRAHGVRGDVLVRGLVSDAAERLVTGATLRTAGPDAREFTVTAHRFHRDDLVLHLDGLDDRTEAEAMVGTQFVIDPDDRRALAPGEWWPEDLIGCAVVDHTGAPIGTVVEVLVGAAQDRLAVETPDGRRGEVPFVDALVPVVDVDARQVVVDLPEGLLEDITPAE